MSRKQLSRIVGLLIVVLSLNAAVAGAQAEDFIDMSRFYYPQSPVKAPSNQAAIMVEVAEDGNRFIFDDLNLFEDGMPAYGSAFVTQGYIYPVGTLNGSNGVLANGEPEFPDLVLGDWTCFGWMIGDGARTETGEWVISTQVYKFNDGSTLITDGFEIVDFEMPVARAITGGTGEHRSASGEHIQVLHGFTEQMGVNLTVTFHLDN